MFDGYFNMYSITKDGGIKPRESFGMDYVVDQDQE